MQRETAVSWKKNPQRQIPILVQEILLLRTVGGSGSILGRYYYIFIVFVHASLVIYCWLLLVRRNLNGHGPLDLAQYSHSFVVKPALYLFICVPLCYLFFRILSISSPQTFAQNGVLTCLGPLVTRSFRCVISCALLKYNISMIVFRAGVGVQVRVSEWLNFMLLRPLTAV